MAEPEGDPQRRNLRQPQIAKYSAFGFRLGFLHTPFRFPPTSAQTRAGKEWIRRARPSGEGKLMQHIQRVIIVRNSIFDHELKDWIYQFENGVHRAILARTGWQVVIWNRSGQFGTDAHLKYDPISFLEQCRSLEHGHTLDVWVQGQGMVLSTEWTALRLRIVCLEVDPWEDMCVDLDGLRTERH